MKPGATLLQVVVLAAALMDGPGMRGALADNEGVGAAPAQATDVPVPPAPVRDDIPCDEPGVDYRDWLSRLQRGVYGGVCGATEWFDGLFGNPRYDQDSDETYGRAGVFQTLDRRDNLDTRLRLRARLALPALKNRARLTLGRGTEEQVIEERPSTSENPLPPGFNSVDDDAWLLGLGYSKQAPLEDGFDFGIGVRLRTPIDPYAKGSYRYNFIFSERTMLRARETLFWRDSRGFGATTQLALDHLFAPNLLLRWNNSGTVAEDTQGLDWFSGITAFQNLGRRRALSWSLLSAGQTAAEVGLRNYGIETRYRQRLGREWLFVEFDASLTWPRERREERREINPGIGIGFEMYFGPVPEDQMR